MRASALRRRLLLPLAVTVFATLALHARCQAAPVTTADPRAPRAVTVTNDSEDKAGSTLLVEWKAPTAPPGEGKELVGYQVSVAEEGKDFQPESPLPPKATDSKAKDLYPGRSYRIKVAALYAESGSPWIAPGAEAPKPEPGKPAAKQAEVVSSAEVGPAVPVGLWYDPAKTNVLVGVLLYTIVVILCFAYARRKDMYVRPIAGLQAVDDAIGRATEMGRPMLFVSGLTYLGEISTIASALFLGHLARRTAAYETPILVPCYDPLVMAAEREIVREAYLEAGHPQTYRPDNIFFVTDSQFGYVAAVDGLMVREKPAANFFVGFFYAESLILAETGNQTGAIQIAATDADTQIPFFVTACDYTLMGEELYAASAYLSRHPTLLAQLKGQDIGKAIITCLLVLGTLAATAEAFGFKQVADLVLKWFSAQ
ncbi:MAG: fibronectin type III domain-containing protein [Armatimonadia bacterium]